MTYDDVARWRVPYVLAGCEREFSSSPICVFSTNNQARRESDRDWGSWMEASLESLPPCGMLWEGIVIALVVVS
jgi:hypothetical protein